MNAEWLPFHRLVELGWELQEGKGVKTPHFTSVSFCLSRESQIKCVQGYGRTLAEALADATEQANAWLKTHPHEHGSENGFGPRLFV